MIRAGDLFGDGVNIAARLQSIAKPGGVCISGPTYDQVRKVLPMTFVDLGAQQVKNIQEPIRAYQVGTPSGTQEVAFAPVAEADSSPPLPDKPSIAVLPFENMSDDPKQEYFADGMVEEIITALSRFKSLFVIARNSSFTYKGKAVDIKKVGRELGVRYVLEGSVRKASGRVRITGQLIDAVTGVHIWVDRFERDLTDVFCPSGRSHGRRCFSHSAEVAPNRDCNSGAAVTGEPHGLRLLSPCFATVLPSDPRRFGRGNQAGPSRFGVGPSLRPCCSSCR
jgi:adenylate cyclase